MSCGVGRRHGSDPALLWLWLRPVAAAPMQPLAWETPCAVGAVLEKTKKKKKKKRPQIINAGEDVEKREKKTTNNKCW